MKQLTAKEARDMANNSKLVNRVTNSILRDIKRAAKRGKYSLSLYFNWDDVVVSKVCQRLEELGYRAHRDIWRAAIYIFWDK